MDDNGDGLQQWTETAMEIAMEHAIDKWTEMDDNGDGWQQWMATMEGDGNN